jgi:hypothetical protein
MASVNEDSPALDSNVISQNPFWEKAMHSISRVNAEHP